MNTGSPLSATNSMVLIVLGLIAVSLVVVELSGSIASIPLISTDRAALIALLVVGMAMCAVGGIGPAVASQGWNSPYTLTGAALGIVALLVAGTALLGIRLPLIPDDRTAFLVLAGIGLLKVIFNLVYSLLAR